MKNIFFVHIPKSGGTSLIKSLNSAGYKKCFFYAEEKFLELVSSNFLHNHSFQAGHIIGATAEKFFGETHKIFTIIRNPIRIFMSTLNYIKLRPAYTNLDETSIKVSQLHIEDIVEREYEFYNLIHPSLVFLGFDRLEPEKIDTSMLVKNALDFAERHTVLHLENTSLIKSGLSELAGINIPSFLEENLTSELGNQIFFESLEKGLQLKIRNILQPDIEVYEKITNLSIE